MAWWGAWDSGNLTKVASAALKNAQKRIDKVLDIPEQGGPVGRPSQAMPERSTTPTDTDSYQSDDIYETLLHAPILETSHQSTTSSVSSDKPVKRSSLTSHSTQKSSRSSLKKKASVPLASDVGFDDWPTQNSDMTLPREGDWVTGDSMTASTLSAFISQSKGPHSSLEDTKDEENAPETGDCFEEQPTTSPELNLQPTPCKETDLAVLPPEVACLHADIEELNTGDSQGSSSDTVSNAPTLIEVATVLSTVNTSFSTTSSTNALCSQADTYVSCTSGTDDEVMIENEKSLGRNEIMLESVASCPSSIFNTESHIANVQTGLPLDESKELSLNYRLVHSDITWHNDNSDTATDTSITNAEVEKVSEPEVENSALLDSSYANFDPPMEYSSQNLTSMSPLSVDVLLDSTTSDRTLQQHSLVEESIPDTRQQTSLLSPQLRSPNSELSGQDLAIHFETSGICGGIASISDAATTCTSSDIEVISSCCASSVNGDVTNHFLSSLSHPSDVHNSVAQKNSFAHKRTASGSNLLNSTAALRNMQSMDQPNNSMTAELLMKKLVECREVLEMRENKLLEQNRENILLREELSELKYSIERSRDDESATHTNIERLTQEFTGRLQNAEKRFQMASRERDQLKKQIQRLEIELASKNDSELVGQALREKEDQIAELLREGEKLAQEQMKKGVLIKTMRMKEKEMESQITKLNEKVGKLTLEVEQLKKQVSQKEETEKKHVEGINQLTKSVQWQEKEIAHLKTELEDSLTKSRGYQNALETSTKENVTVLRQVQALQTELETLRSQLTNEESGKEHWERREAEWSRELEQHNIDLVDLRTALSRKEREMSRLEENLRSEMSYYQERLSAAEERNEELSQSLSSATKPVLRQLEALQANYAQENANWEKLEASLNTRLIESQRNLVLSTQQERVWRDKVSELEVQISGLEAHNSTLRQESQQLQRDLVEEKKRSCALQLEVDSIGTEKEKLRKSLEAKLAATSKEVVLLQGVVDAEKHKVETEKMKYAQLKAEFVVFSQMTPMNKSASTPTIQEHQSDSNSSYLTQQTSMMTTNSVGDGEESVTSQGSGFQAEKYAGLDASRNAASTSRYQLYDSIRGNGLFTSQAGHAAIMEHLQDLLKQKDGEVMQLHREIQQLQRARDSSSSEIARLHVLVDQKTAEAESVIQRLSGLQNLEVRYQALLELYGEKLEENEELRLDLQDVKEMYKTQIAMLLKEK